jgi:hypothetical protein
MHRICITLSAATAAAALSLSGCSHSDPKPAPAGASSLAPATTSLLAAPPTAPPPAPEALTDVLNRLTDPNVPGSNKVNLVEGSTADSAATLDKFTAALRDNGYLPMTFVANGVAWSDKNPSNVMASITVNTAQGNNRTFTFPMEFAPFQGGWQLSRRTAEMLLALSKSPGLTSPPAPAATPPPAPASTPAPAATPTPAPAETGTPAPTPAG